MLAPQVAPAPLTARDVYAALRQVAQITAAVPALDLDARDRMVLSGRLFCEAPELVGVVAEALADRALFAGLPACPAELVARQERALALRGLQHLLLQMAARAGDLALVDQAEVIDQSMMIVRAVRQEAAAPAASAAARRRACALRLAEDILARRRSRMDRNRRRQADAAPPRAAPAPAQPTHARAAPIRSFVDKMVDPKIDEIGTIQPEPDQTTMKVDSAPGHVRARRGRGPINQQ